MMTVMRRAYIAYLCLSIVLVVGCSPSERSATATSTTAPQASPLPSTASPEAGVVTGFIEPCVRLSTTRVPFAAGTVIASSGAGRLHPVSGGAPDIRPNGNVAARQHVREDQAYRLVLAPGPYVLTTIYDDITFPHSFIRVTVRPQATLHRNLGITCK